MKSQLWLSTTILFLINGASTLTLGTVLQTPAPTTTTATQPPTSPLDASVRSEIQDWQNSFAARTKDPGFFSYKLHLDPRLKVNGLSNRKKVSQKVIDDENGIVQRLANANLATLHCAAGDCLLYIKAVDADKVNNLLTTLTKEDDSAKKSFLAYQQREAAKQKLIDMQNEENRAQIAKQEALANAAKIQATKEQNKNKAPQSEQILGDWNLVTMETSGTILRIESDKGGKINVSTCQDSVYWASGGVECAPKAAENVDPAPFILNESFNGFCDKSLACPNQGLQVSEKDPRILVQSQNPLDHIIDGEEKRLSDPANHTYQKIDEKFQRPLINSVPVSKASIAQAIGAIAGDWSNSRANLVQKEIIRLSPKGKVGFISLSCKNESLEQSKGTQCGATVGAYYYYQPQFKGFCKLDQGTCVAGLFLNPQTGSLQLIVDPLKIRNSVMSGQVAQEYKRLER